MKLFPLPNPFPDGPYGDDFQGLIDSIRGLKNVLVFSNLSTVSFASTTASYSDFGNTTGDFTKLGDSADSDLMVFVALSCFVQTNANTECQVGMSLGGTDFDILTQMINPVSEHTPLAGFRVCSGLSSGQLNPKLRGLRASGLGTFVANTDDYATYALIELPKS